MVKFSKIDKTQRILKFKLDYFSHILENMGFLEPYYMYANYVKQFSN